MVASDTRSRVRLRYKLVQIKHGATDQLKVILRDLEIVLIIYSQQPFRPRTAGSEEVDIAPVIHGVRIKSNPSLVLCSNTFTDKVYQPCIIKPINVMTFGT